MIAAASTGAQAPSSRHPSWLHTLLQTHIAPSLPRRLNAGQPNCQGSGGLAGRRGGGMHAAAHRCRQDAPAAGPQRAVQGCVRGVLAQAHKLTVPSVRGKVPCMECVRGQLCRRQGISPPARLLPPSHPAPLLFDARSQLSNPCTPPAPTPLARRHGALHPHHRGAGGRALPVEGPHPFPGPADPQVRAAHGIQRLLPGAHARQGGWRPNAVGLSWVSDLACGQAPLRGMSHMGSSTRLMRDKVGRGLRGAAQIQGPECRRCLRSSAAGRAVHAAEKQLMPACRSRPPQPAPPSLHPSFRCRTAS